MSERPNGIDLDALGLMVEAISADPAEARAAFRVATRWTGGTRSETRVSDYVLGGETIDRGFTIAADEPREVLGGDSAACPQELLMAAVNACMTVGYVANAALRGIAIEALEIETRGTLDLRGFLDLSDDVAPGVGALDYVVRIRGGGSDAQLAELHAAVARTSPTLFDLTRAMAVTGRIERI